MEFRLLGPLEVLAADRVIDLGSPRQQALLALLLIRRNEVVPLDVIVASLWPGDPPRTAAQIIRVYVSQLRKLLGDDEERSVLVTHANGYSLLTGTDEVDADRFELLCDEARDLLSGGEPASARRQLDEALRLWRGDPLPEFAYDDFAAPRSGASPSSDSALSRIGPTPRSRQAIPVTSSPISSSLCVSTR